jgi:hypothetical protein
MSAIVAFSPSFYTTPFSLFLLGNYFVFGASFNNSAEALSSQASIKDFYRIFFSYHLYLPG